MKPEWSFEWVDNEERLTALSEELAREELLSLDTETVGWDTGNERLCLIQIGVPSARKVYIVDALAVQSLQSTEKFLSGAKPVIIAHNAPFEEKQLARHGVKIRGIIDTLTMVRRLRPDLPNHTLQTCCKILLDFDLSKEQQISDWSKRPLSEAQIDYARLDAEVAVKLYLSLAELESQLEVDLNLSVPQLMEQLVDTLKKRLVMTREIAADLAILNARDELIREAIRTKLINGEPEYDGEYGKCKVSRIKRTEINPLKVRNLFPDIADMAISEYVERERFKSLMREYGIPESKIEQVRDITGYQDRLSISFKDVW